MDLNRNKQVPFLEDDVLLKQVVDGNIMAYQQLYKRYAKPLYMLVFYRTEDKPAAEDIVQELFMELWEKAAEVQYKN